MSNVTNGFVTSPANGRCERFSASAVSRGINAQQRECQVVQWHLSIQQLSIGITRHASRMDIPLCLLHLAVGSPNPCF